MSYLDVKYINMIAARLSRFAWKKTNQLAVCRCPVCGDSKRNKTKTRFYFYEKKGGFFVKCHNCDFGTTLAKFIEQFDRRLYDEYTLEKYRGGLTGRNEAEPAFTFEQPRFERTENHNTNSSELGIGLPKISELPEAHPAKAFLQARLIPNSAYDLLYYAENFGEWAKTIDPEKILGDEPRLIIPIVYDGILIGANCRVLDGSQGKNIRYITLRKEKGEDRMWFGLERVTPDNPVIVVEGPLDSLFLPNGVATAGLGRTVTLPKELGFNPIFALDNEPRNREVVKTVEWLIDNGRTVCIWPDSVTQKDINDMVLAGVNPHQIILKNACRGAEAKLKFMRWKKC
jgi:hypothetical protein